MTKPTMVTNAEAADSLQWHRRATSNNTCAGCGNGWPCTPKRLLACRERMLALAEDIWGDLQALEGGVSHEVTMRLILLLKEAHGD